MSFSLLEDYVGCSFLMSLHFTLKLQVALAFPIAARLGAVSSTPGPSCRAVQSVGDAVDNDNYWMQPPGTNTSLLVFCHMSLLGVWKAVNLSWLSSKQSAGVTITTSESNGRLVISGTVTDNGCGSGIGSASIIYIKGYWTKIRYKQEFRGIASCWRIFGNQNYDDKGGNIGRINHGLFAFDKNVDEISNEQYMAGTSGNKFDGATIKCDNEDSNLWRVVVSGGVRYATVTLRRNPAIALAGIFTGTSCGKPTYFIKDIDIYY